MVTAAGVSVGLVGHTVLATLGLGVILRTSEWLFLALKLVGAAYLFYLGIGLLRTKRSNLAIAATGVRPLGKLFLDGAFSNLSNPKVAIFYFAFLPQFVSPSAQHPTISLFVLGVAFAGLTFLVKAPVAVFSGALSAWLQSRPGVLAGVYRFSAGHCQVKFGKSRAGNFAKTAVTLKKIIDWRSSDGPLRFIV